MDLRFEHIDVKSPMTKARKKKALTNNLRDKSTQTYLHTGQKHKCLCDYVRGGLYAMDLKFRFKSIEVCEHLSFSDLQTTCVFVQRSNISFEIHVQGEDRYNDFVMQKYTIPHSVCLCCIDSATFLAMQRNTLKQCGTSYNFVILLALTEKNKSAMQKKEENEENIESFRMAVLDLIDTNKDGKVELGEFAKLIPIESNFMEQFSKRKSLSRKEFDDIFNHYDPV
ncbi:hypothetical protein HELRODRAFT_160319 [Helobdella robusta]|uniref:EF-hand domain-containing protein n=1 Tax=Helobdella robusta TaxID=6412 RepID=T1EQ33_HELRO|nr:hypothetical protein HELRODRAFT_160319 [Helobdella robusta]ESO06167.1 hypothetical protein HELRODRAFT_160319 [Helobdella robusta]